MNGPLTTDERRSVRKVRFMIACGTVTITALMVAGLLLASPPTLAGAGNLYSVLVLFNVILFAGLTAWIAFGFCVATAGIIGFLRNCSIGQIPSSGTPQGDHENGELKPSAGRIALIVPIYNEDAAAVMACVQATAESLRRTGQGGRFDMFILSDTTEPETWVREEILWSALRADLGGGSPAVHYRHRVENRGRKAGNIGEFLERWGLDYEYFLILDADSTMDGRTLVELARRMDANDRLGILQSPPIPEGRESVWARAQQFSARVYGPLFNCGLVAWTGRDGNYWGHNAMIRTYAFLKHCGLSKLPGREPLGGEILSHDFVEAGLMRRAGYEVRLAADLGGGYEQCPTTIDDHARRDQRWCQGNLQHLRIAVAPAWHPVSRWHFFSGAMSYLASPLWLLFLLSGLLIFWTGDTQQARPLAAVLVFASAMLMLILPKVIAVGIHYRHGATGVYGGKSKLAASLLVESLVSVAVAPLMMMYHSRFALLTLAGRKVRWNAQVRTDDGITLRDAARTHGAQTAVGVLATAVLAWFAPQLLLWASPLLFGMLLAIPMGKLLASPDAGRWLARRGLLLTPEETSPPRVLRRRDVLYRKYLQMGEPQNAGQSLFASVLIKPALYRLHQSLLAASMSPPENSPESSGGLSRGTLRKMRRTIRKRGIESVPMALRRKILSDPDGLRKLHVEHWGNRLAA